jgi:transcriptional regulator with XRE-family HTH domain
MSNIGTKIKKYRKQKGFTQVKLAELLEVDHSFISKIESGKKIPSLFQLEKLARILSLPPSVLLEDSTLISTLRGLSERFDYDEILKGINQLLEEIKKDNHP